MITSYWMKLYVEILDDPKMGTLPDHLWRRCIEIFLLAKRQCADGQLPTPDDIAWALRTTKQDVEECLAALEERQIVHQNGGAWHVTNFVKRQGPSPVQERVKRYRERQRTGNEDVTVRKQCNAPETETETEKSIDADVTVTIENAAQDKGQQGMDLFLPLAALCKYDLSVITTAQKNELYGAVGRLMNGAHATPKDLDQFREFWETRDWRGKQMQAPKPAQVLEAWGAFRSWQVNPSGGSKPKAKFL